MTVGSVCDTLVAKNHVEPSLHWALIERLPDLHMGKSNIFTDMQLIS